MKIFLKALVIINGVVFWLILYRLFSFPDSTGPAWAYLYVMGSLLDGVAAACMWHMVEIGLKDQP